MLETKIGSLCLHSPIFNASGPRSTDYQALHEIDESESSAVLSKTCTLEPKIGHPHPRLHIFDDSSVINAIGLENEGLDYYLSLKFVHPYIISIKGDASTLSEMLQKIKKCDHVQGVEINISCPSVPIEFNVQEILKIIQNNGQKHQIIGIKLGPFASKEEARKVVHMIALTQCIQFITLINSIPHALALRRNQPLLSNQYGGLSGTAIKCIARGNVYMCWQLLTEFHRQDIAIIGVGGIFCGQDVLDMMLCGASAVQIGSCHLIEGPTCFQRITSEFRDVMRANGYKCVKDISCATWSKL